MGNPFAMLAGVGVIGALALVVIGIALSALVLSVAFRLVVGYMPAYSRAVVAVVAIWLATLVAELVLAIVIRGPTGGVLTALVMFLVGAWVVNRLLRTDTGLAIGFGRACLVQLAYMVIAFLLALLLGFVLMLVFGAAFMGMLH